MKINFISSYQPTDAALVLFAFKGDGLGAESKKLDAAVGGQLSRAMKVAKFENGFCETVSVTSPQGLKARRIIVVGLGDKKKFDDVAMEEAASSVLKLLKDANESKATLLLDLPKVLRKNTDKIAAHMAFGLTLGGYDFRKYKTEKPKSEVQEINIVTLNVERTKKTFEPLSILAEATAFTADLMNEPPNVLYPGSYVERIKSLAKFGLKIEILDEAEIKKLGMGALMGVGMGSDKRPYVAVLQWLGARSKKAKPLALVGKGVTFDTGGYNIKPGDSMLEMKDDMTGSAIVVGTMMALAKRKAKANVVGIVGLVENMISGGAQRPSDIVKTMKGTTVEIINTDAEGRMVLADVLWYTVQRFAPEQIIDFATLTGAAMVALGGNRAALFSNNKKISDNIFKIGEEYNELTWPMPLDAFYREKLNSKVADIKHTGDRFGGAITAAKFLQEFVDGTPWAHIDICDTVRKARDKNTKAPVYPVFGLRLMHQYISKHIED